MKEMYQLESDYYRAGEKAYNNLVNSFADDDDFEVCGDEVYKISYVMTYEFIAYCKNLTPAQVADLQDTLYSVNEDCDAFVSGLYLLDEDDEIDVDYFIYRRKMSEDEFDLIFGIFSDYQKMGLDFIYSRIGRAKKVYTEIDPYDYC